MFTSSPPTVYGRYGEQNVVKIKNEENFLDMCDLKLKNSRNCEKSCQKINVPLFDPEIRMKGRLDKCDRHQTKNISKSDGE